MVTVPVYVPACRFVGFNCTARLFGVDRAFAPGIKSHDWPKGFVAAVTVKPREVRLSLLESGTVTVMGVLDPGGAVCVMLLRPTLITGWFTTLRVTLTVVDVVESTGVRVMIPVHVAGLVRPATAALTLIGVPFCPELVCVLTLVAGETERKLLQFDTVVALNVMGVPVLETVIVDGAGGCWPS